MAIVQTTARKRVLALVQTGPIASVKNTLRHRLTGDVYAGDAIGISL